MIIGISGGISSGKNLVSSIFSNYDSVIFDADQEVKNLIANNSEVIRKINDNLPEIFDNNILNKNKLREKLFSTNCEYNKIITILEDILHPIIRMICNDFVKLQNNKKFIILNIPLLIESNAYFYDKLITINCDKEIRKKRYLLKMQNITNSDKIFEILSSRQISDIKRRDYGDFIINNNKSIISTIYQTKKIIEKLLTKQSQ
jgi:dephospho-CoA kinase